MKKISIVAAVVVAMCLSAVLAERWNMFERRLVMFVHWGIYSVGEWHEQEEMRRALQLIREKQPDAKLVWCSSTPLANDVKTAKCRELNAAAAKVVAELGGIETDDLFSLLDPFDRATNWSDEYHHRGALQKKESEQVAASVLSANEEASK